MKLNYRGWWHPLWLGGMLLAVACPFRAAALDPERSIYQYNCQTWRRANGLPGNAITAIAQSGDGHLWVGTSQGLVYFDGVGFRVFEMVGAKGSESKVINALARRTAGGLWVGLERGSFGFFDAEQFHSLQSDKWGGAFATVRSVLESHDGTLLVGGSGITGRFVDTNTWKSLEPIRNADTFTIYEDPRGRIWLGTA